MKRVFTLLVVVLLVCGLVVACGGDKEDPKPVEDDVVTEQPADEIVDDEPINAAPDMKTFDNVVDHNDYSIEYPNSWEIEEGEDEITLKPMDDEIFSTQINISNMDMPGLSSGDVDELIEETKKQMGDEDMGFEFEKIKFNGYEAMKMSMSIMGISVETYNIPMNGVFVIIAANFDSDTEAEVKEILETFRLK